MNSQFSGRAGEFYWSGSVWLISSGLAQLAGWVLAGQSGVWQTVGWSIKGRPGHMCLKILRLALGFHMAAGVSKPLLESHLLPNCRPKKVTREPRFREAERETPSLDWKEPQTFVALL